MEITIRHIPDCPNLGKAEQRVRGALAGSGLRETSVRFEEIATPEEAERLGFAGSPTILVDGIDAFAVEGAAALGCRRYDTPDGPDTAPSVDQLRAVFES